MPTTGLADSFNANLNYSVNIVVDVYGMAVQADGKIVAGGTFDLAGGQSRKQIARLETDGRVDRTLKISIAGGEVLATAVQADGKTLIGGSFTTVFSMARNRIARLNTDGSLDTGFQPEREWRRRFNCGAGGRQDFGGRRVQRNEQHRRTGA